MPRKRRSASKDVGTPSPSKKRAIEIASTDSQEEEEEEEYVSRMIAQIQAQEESEALARQLHHEWNDSASGSQSTSSSVNPSSHEHNQHYPKEVITIDDDDIPESDEALARRLQHEWDGEVFPIDAPVTVPSLPTPPSSKPAVRPRPIARSRHPDVKGKAPARPLNHTSTTEVTTVSSTPPPDELLATFRDLFVQTRECSKCGKDVQSPRGHVSYTQNVPPPSLLSLLHAPCSCGTNHCRGCFAPVNCPSSCRGKVGDDLCPVTTCCAQVRAIALFEALGGLDRLYIAEQDTARSRAKESSAKRKQSAGSVGPGGTGYATGSAHYDHFMGLYSPRGGSSRRGKGRGRGRGGHAASDPSPTFTVSVSEQMAAHWDELLVRALTTITSLLPAPYAEDIKEYDILPNGSISPLLSLSQLPELLGGLLRNDSVSEWINRSEVYYAILGLLRRMADCELSIQTLIGQRYEMKKSCGIEDWMWQDGEITWETSNGGSELVQATPLYTYFQKLTKQCGAFMAGASHMFEDDTGEDIETMIKTTSLCGDIIAAQGDIDRAMKVMGKDPSSLLAFSGSPTPNGTDPSGSSTRKGKNKDLSLELDKQYAHECERLAFRHVTLSQPSPHRHGLIYPNFNYTEELDKTASATRNPKDRLHLIKELAVMATSLPAGIWMRVDEIRNDVIKVMIAGPEGTPYAGGLFEFDCFIPIEYPHKPPLMHLRTTAGGKVRFNPNLYNSGKVCLSLLGTWPGRPEEMWSPKSTLLQVFVSIQSMILIDLPYFNEPGFGPANPTNHQSIAYNKNISLQTTRWAIVDWLKDENKNGTWAEVIHSHFTLRQDKIRKCIQEWAKSEPQIHKYVSRGSTATMAEAQLLDIIPDDVFTDSENDFYGSDVDNEESLLVIPGHWGPHKATGPRGSRARNPMPKTESPTTMDLLVEFDKGVEKIKLWDLRPASEEGAAGSD